MRVNHPKFCRLSTKGVLLVVTLKVVHSIHAFFIKHNQTFVGGPAELDDLALIPLFVWGNSVSVGMRTHIWDGPKGSRDSLPQENTTVFETLTRRGQTLVL